MKAPQDIILKPVITEQSTDRLSQGKYTFKVVNVRGRQKRVGRYTGTTSSWKKAVVTVNPEPSADKNGKKRNGTIEFFDGMF